MAILKGKSNQEVLLELDTKIGQLTKELEAKDAEIAKLKHRLELVMSKVVSDLAFDAEIKNLQLSAMRLELSRLRNG